MDAQIARLPVTRPDDPPPERPDCLRAARAGDPAAFGQLVRSHQARVFSVALRLTGRRADAEDLAQDVFVQLHGALDRIEDERHLKHWLLRAVSHRSIDWLRQNGRRAWLVPLEAVGEAREPAAEDAPQDPLARAHLRRLLLQLKPDARAVVLLRFQEDLDPTDIAEVLGMSLNTVKSHLRRSLDWLRAQYDGAEDGHRT